MNERTHYLGKLCPRHLDLKGERYKSSRCCVACVREGVRRARTRPEGRGRREYLRKRRRRHNNPTKYLWERAKRRSKQLNIPFDIELGDIIIPDRCFVFGFPIQVMSDDQDCSATVDRIINHLGYVKGNIVVVSWLANQLKRDASLLELRLLAKFYKRFERRR